VPSGEVEHHTRGVHALIGLSYDLTNQWALFLEDRYQFAFADVVNTGEVNVGGNALFVGVSFVLAPEPTLAPHGDSTLR
jgi:hypothetical protein